MKITIVAALVALLLSGCGKPTHLIREIKRVHRGMERIEILMDKMAPHLFAHRYGSRLIDEDGGFWANPYCFTAQRVLEVQHDDAHFEKAEATDAGRLIANETGDPLLVSGTLAVGFGLTADSTLLPGALAIEPGEIVKVSLEPMDTEGEQTAVQFVEARLCEETWHVGSVTGGWHATTEKREWRERVTLDSIMVDLGGADAEAPGEQPDLKVTAEGKILDY